jgi:predicted ATPase
MKKLSRLELNVVVNEVLNGLREIENEKINGKFEKCSKKDEFLNLCKELDDLEGKVIELNKKVVIIGNEIKEESGVGVLYRSRNNRVIFNNDKIYSVFGNLNVGNNFSKIESEIILSCIEGSAVRNLISSLIKKFKKEIK